MIALLILAPATHAASLCETLAAQLAGATDNAVFSIEARKYAKAIAKQNMQLRKIRSSMRDIGCGNGSITIIGGVKQVRCNQFEDAVQRMRANLEILAAKRDTARQYSVNGLSRQQLNRAIWENGCDIGSDDTVRRKVSFERNDDTMETIRVPGDTQDRYGRFIDLGGAANAGGLKTMCVRTCDGGFFPISSRASTLNFQRDAQVCSMMCPGTNTELYYQSILSDDTGNMRSVETGQPYLNLSTAFSFRTIGQKAKDPSCGCNLTAYHTEMMRRENAIKNPSTPAKASSIVWSKPALRSALPSDSALSELMTAKVVEREWQPDPKIRRVGPQYLPDEENRIDFSRPLR